MMTLSFLVTCALAQFQGHPLGYEAGPVDPWGTGELGIKVRAEVTRIRKDSKSTELYISALLGRNEKKIEVVTISKTDKSIMTRTRDVAGSYHIEPEQVLETKTGEEKIAVAGKTLDCKVTTVKFKVLGSDDQETLKVWQSAQVPGGVARYEKLRPYDPVDADKKLSGEVTRWDETLSVGDQKVTCCVFTSRGWGGVKVEAWHCDTLPGKVARIVTQRGDEREEWSVLSTAPTELPKRK
jgi:hypothetical protein